jgi:hypothetical protein
VPHPPVTGGTPGRSGAGQAAKAAEPSPPTASGAAPRHPREPARRTPVAGVGPRLPRISRPTGLASAPRPGEVPEPQHRHLPGWVRRVHGQARPVLADLLGALAAEPRQQFEGQVAELVAGINAGRFSLAWQYPQLIDQGWALVEHSRREAEAQARRRQGVEVARRRMSEQLREAADRLTSETAGRLHRSLGAASDVEGIRQIGTELGQALNSARSVEERRRDREIDRTRERLRRSLPQGGGEEPPSESWQDALRRIADQVSA